jgi:hypothetical protein
LHSKLTKDIFVIDTMKQTITKSALLTIILLGLPMLGVLAAKKEITLYLEFPPHTSYVPHAPFSWPVFLAYTVFILALVTPFLVHLARADQGERVATSRDILPFPWWGWAGILFGIISWILAWTRLRWLAGFQAHTFTPLWLGYIVTINALTYRQSGRCMLRNSPCSFLLLFPVSAAFWWFFEYLNRFVQNWHYVGPLFGPWEYFWYATLPFSTVLPAIMGTRDWLLSFSWTQQNFQMFFPIHLSRPRAVAWPVLLATAAGLAGIGIWPNYLFPLVWVSPVLIIISLQTMFGQYHLFSPLSHGDWRDVFSSALAALVCGLFWEMWNAYSLAKWEYSIPFVHRFEVFEMPLLGYAGYLPFGWVCAVISRIVIKEGTNR